MLRFHAWKKTVLSPEDNWLNSCIMARVGTLGKWAKREREKRWYKGGKERPCGSGSLHEWSCRKCSSGTRPFSRLFARCSWLAYTPSAAHSMYRNNNGFPLRLCSSVGSGCVTYLNVRWWSAWKFFLCAVYGVRPHVVKSRDGLPVNRGPVSTIFLRSPTRCVTCIIGVPDLLVTVSTLRCELHT